MATAINIENIQTALRTWRENLEARRPSPVPTGDAFHTVAELYEQRALLHALYVNLARDQHGPGENGFGATKSWRHHDGSPCFDIGEDGHRWFVVTTFLPNGTQVTFHYPEDLWDAFHINAVDVAPVWDGHNAREGMDRMRHFLGLWTGE